MLIAELARFFRCLALLDERGQLPLLDGLELLTTECADPTLQGELRTVCDQVAQGDPLCHALANVPGLPAVALRAIWSAEAHGDLPASLRFAADVVAWQNAPPLPHVRAVTALLGALEAGFPIEAALQTDSFPEREARQQVRHLNERLAALGEIRFGEAPLLFPPPLPPVLERAAQGGFLQAALSSLHADLVCGRLVLFPDGQPLSTQLSHVLRFLAWALSFGLNYTKALESSVHLVDDHRLHRDLARAVTHESLSAALASRPKRYPCSLPLVIRRGAEDDGDPVGTFLCVADALEAGLYRLDDDPDD